MLRPVLFAKIHMANVTRANPDYVGSITIDADLLEATDLRVSDKVLVANCRNGERFETYIFRGEPGSGAIEVNGAAAHKVETGDKVIILHFAQMTDDEYRSFHPKVALVTEDNRLRELLRYEPGP